MKIQKQFIPLIESGEKKYEFRNSKEHFGRFYEVNGKTFYLDAYKLSAKFNGVLDKNGDVYSLKFKRDDYRLIITKEEYDWLKENWDTYFDSWIWIGIWEEVRLSKLEVIDNE